MNDTPSNIYHIISDTSFAPNFLGKLLLFYDFLFVVL